MGNVGWRRNVALATGVLMLAACGPKREDSGPFADDSIVSVRGAICTVQPLPTYCGITLWPGGNIPYDYDPAIPGSETTAGSMRYNIRQAMDAWQTATGNRITFTQSSTDPERDIIYPSGGCSSSIGWDPAPGTQGTYLAEGCPHAHELGHLIGLFHEHQRLDRDRYVILNPEAPNCSDYNMWLQCLRTEDDGINLGEYDLSSTMQYGGVGDPPDLTRRDNGQLITTGMGPPTVKDAADVVEMYGRENNVAWTRSVPMGADVSPTAPLNNELAPGVTIAAASTPAVARSRAQVQLFVRGSNNNIYRRITSAWGKPAWSAWLNMGGEMASFSPGATYVDQYPVVGMRGLDGIVYVAGQATGWGWASADQPPGVAVATGPALVSAAPGQLDVFVRGSDNALWHRRRNGTTWEDWTSRGGEITGPPGAVSPSPNVIQVFARSTTGELTRIIADPAWGAWSTVPDSCCLGAGSAPAVVSPNPQRLDVFWRGTDNRLAWRRWDQATGWRPLQRLGGRLASSPAVGAFGTVRIDLFYATAERGLWYRQHRVGRLKGDFDGDGKADLAFFRSGTSTWHISPISGAPAYSVSFNVASKPGLPDDYDNDGRADPVVLASDWRLKVIRSTDNQAMFASGGTPSDVFLDGDYNGDGLADFAQFRLNNKEWWIKPSRGYPDSSGNYFGPPGWTQMYGIYGDIPVPADYDGDGKTDLALYRPDDWTVGIQGKWLIIYSSTGAELSPTPVFGLATDIPVPADYDGDGKTDLAFYRPSEGNWYVRSSLDGTQTITQYGSSSDRPVPKDYDGDGKVDRAFFTPSTGTWRIRKTSNNIEMVIQFGESSDIVF